MLKNAAQITGFSECCYDGHGKPLREAVVTRCQNSTGIDVVTSAVPVSGAWLAEHVTSSGRPRSQVEGATAFRGRWHEACCINHERAPETEVSADKKRHTDADENKNYGCASGGVHKHI